MGFMQSFKTTKVFASHKCQSWILQDIYVPFRFSVTMQVVVFVLFKAIKFFKNYWLEYKFHHTGEIPNTIH
jgi:hypothetical protein